MAFLSTIPPQSREIYALLIKNKMMTAEEIAKKLNILPTAAYRAVRVLVEFGLVERAGHYPVWFKLISPSQSSELYFQQIREEFLQTFYPKGIPVSGATIDKSSMSISFIKDRNELLNQINIDMGKVRKEVNHIVSGLEVPAESILWYKRVVEKGVKVKIIVQNKDEFNTEMLQNWKKLGIDVRYHKLIQARIIIFDSKILYMTSYNPKKKDGAVGTRFEYQPVAKLINDFFKQQWEAAEIV